ncbi:glycosyltransferase involved in cell wall biosynthesis [Flavobacterium sp. 103]|uniref:glycosyltransferase n=1 Tax=Flavobacterium sp. 103 TaxID=2135624 RepID=UPI000D5D98DF|nr:glycosyltransferase [Flavobacterium sp. 103]PVX45893.1 glycosyltransferase involved in cell wall biosynthesis [Flavobacterium sp. 103]
MRVVHIINSLASGGAEKLLLDTIPIYKSKGIEVDLLLLNGSPSPFLQALKETGCCSIYSLGLQSVYNPMQIFKLIPFLKKYDIAQVHLFPSQYWVVLAKILSFSKIKLIVTEHNSTNPRLENRFIAVFDRLFYRFYDKVICVSNEISNTFINYTGLKASKFTVIENGIDLQKIYTAQPYFKNEISNLFSAQDFVMIQVARFDKQKDQETIIHSLKYLPENIKLILVGDGIFKIKCQALVQELQLQERVVFLGLRMDVPRLLKSADVVVLSSRHEGLSLSSIEGMASGKPFVASDVPGLQRIVSDAGVLFKQGNAKDLANTIEKLMINETYYQEIVISCLKRAEQYDIQIMVDKHLHLYQTIV